MVSETITRLITYDDYRHLPDDGKQYQIIGGKLFMTPAPTTVHQRIARELFVNMYNYVKGKDLGEVFFSPTDVILSMTDVIQPDILFVSKKRRHVITKKNIVEAPDVVVEILSEHTKTIDRRKKKQLYERHGVKEYWLIDPDTQTVKVLIQAEEKNELKLYQYFSSEDVLSTPLFSGLKLSLNELWADESR